MQAEPSSARLVARLGRFATNAPHRLPPLTVKPGDPATEAARPLPSFGFSGIKICDCRDVRAEGDQQSGTS